VPRKSAAKQTTLPQIGDVVKSAKFAFGYLRAIDDPVILIDSENKYHYNIHYLSRDEMRKIVIRTGNHQPPNRRRIYMGRIDKTLATAEFVVEDAEVQSGRGDVFPPILDGWRGRARRLNSDGTYNPDGEQIRFWLAGDYPGTLQLSEIQIIRHMRPWFI